MRTARRTATAIAFASVLLATTVVTACGTPSDSRKAEAVLAVMPELRAFVAETRKLAFKHPVDVELLNDKDFASRLNGGGRVDDFFALRQTDDAVSFWRAFGLVHGTVDTAALAKAGDRSVGGFYESGAKRLFIRLAEVTPLQKMILVHELTHALDDQWFGLSRPTLTGEARRGWKALVEGSASIVERRFYDTRSAEEQRQIDAEEDALVARIAAIPAPLAAEGVFPYGAGERFAETLFAQGSVVLNDAFNRPPQTSEQALHPERYGSKEKAIEVVGPQADGPVTASGVLGEAGLSILLRDAVDRETVTRAAEGWGGDRYVIWRDGKRTCVRLRLVMDTATDKAEAFDALRAWAAKVPGATVEAPDAAPAAPGANEIVTTSCGDPDA